MELFDFIKIIFSNPEEYAKIMPGEKRKHFFMCNRRFSIQHPLQANALQISKINQEAVIDWWQRFLRTTYKGYYPKWMYTTGVKKAQESKEKKIKVSNELIREFCKWNKIDKKTVEDALEFFPEKMLNELKSFEKITK
jgi:hypothetical protein